MAIPYSTSGVDLSIPSFNLNTPTLGTSLSALNTGQSNTGATVNPVQTTNTGGMFSSGLDWLGDNSQGLGSLLQGIGALGSMFQTNQQLGLAKDNLNLQKDSYNTNLNNQITSYNTSLEDKIRGRNTASDTSESAIQDYVNKNKMTR